MKYAYYMKRGIRLIRLLCLKLTSGSNIHFVSRLRSFNVSCDTAFSIENGGKMTLGSFSTHTNVHLSVCGGSLEIGNGCSFNRNDIIVSMQNIHIGDGSIFGPNVCIYDHDHVFNKTGIIKGKYKSSRIYIGKNVWIGAGVTILRGSTIGDNSIVGAGCVINGEIPTNTLVTMENRNLHFSALHD